MNNTKKRTLAEMERNLFAGNPLSYNDILALIDAYEYGTATPMIALIKCLRRMHLTVEVGKQIHYIDKNGCEKTICINNFDEFVLNTFDEFVLKEIYNDKN